MFSALKRMGECFVVVAMIASMVLSCSSDSPTSDKNGKDDAGDSIKTGDVKTYAVDSTGSLIVRDTVSGMSFSFPEGAAGTLSVAPVTASPEIGIEAAKVAVSYTGDDTVEILVPKTVGGEDMAFVYTRRTGVMVDDFDGEYSWWGVPSAGERDGSVVFPLSHLMADSETAKTAAGAANHSIVLAIASFPPNSPTAQRTAALRTSVEQCVNWWLDNLPSDLSSAVRAQVEGDMKYGIAFTSSGNAYDHIGSMFGPKAVIELCISDDSEKAANIHTVAHEVGHYMHHLLVGTRRYEECLDRMPRHWWGGIKAHGYADYREPRLYVVEEYAFLSDALITGTVDATDITQPFTRVIFESKQPDERDFPSHEGFGVLLFGALYRSVPEVTCFWPKSPKIAAPVVGAPVGDILALVASGARDVNELRSAVQNYLDTRRADRFKLPAMLEPLGWSYNGVGFVKDTNGDPVAGAIVSSICQDGEREYRAGYSTPTLASGEFTLPRIYPGTNNLRIYWNDWKDSTDVAFTADWSKPTNQTLQMGAITIDTTPAPVTITKNITYYPHVITYGSQQVAEVTPVVSFSATGSGLIQSEYESVLRAPVGSRVSVEITVSFNVRVISTTNESGKLRFDLKEPTLNTDMDSVLEARGNVDMTDNRSANTIACTFTLKDTEATVAMRTFFGYWFPVFDEKGEVVFEEWGSSWWGPSFGVWAIK